MTDAVPPDKQCTMCEREAVDPERQGALCPEHHPDAGEDTEINQQPGEEKGSVLVKDETDENPEPEGGSPGSNPTPKTDTNRSAGADWGAVDFTKTESGTYPDTLLEREQWMVRGADYPPKDRDKAPFAPWNEAAQWGEKENRAGFSTAQEWDATDPRSDGFAFIQTDTDPFAFVDGDNVRCPETGAVHPEFVEILKRLGATYADISTSGTGVHANYLGELPNGQGQATFEIDTEPWGENDSLPAVEIYTNKHVCVTTGEHIVGTPEDVQQWDRDAVETILEEYDELKDTEPIEHDTDRDLELDDHNPEATANDENTTDVRDILLAIDRLEPSDLRLRTRQTGTDSTGWSTWDPSYRSSESGESLHYNGEGVFHDHKHGEAFGVLRLFAAEEGILSNPWDRLAGGDWWEAIEAAREAGAPIPEYDGPKANDTDHTAILPPAVRDLSTATSGWDWEHTAQNTDALSIDEVRDRTTEAIADAYERYDQTLIDVLPTAGKTYGSIKAAAKTGEQITFLTGRGRKEQYDQLKQWCDEFGLTYYQLPAFTHDCDTANGEHGEDAKETVLDWYHRGATPKEIHKAAEYVRGEPLPCQQYEGQQCPYTSKWDFDPDEIDVLIGHPTHAHKSKVTNGRAVVFDEFPDFESRLVALQSAVSYWLETTDPVPFESYTDLIENRDDQQRRGEALLWFEEAGVEPDEEHVFDDSKAHADAPIVVFTLLAGEDLGNGFEEADLGDLGESVFNRDTGEVFALRPPDLEYTSGVVALDGTPTKRMWDLALGERLTHREVLQEEEKVEYIKETLNHNFVRSTDYIKPYNSTDHVTVENDAALLEAIAEEYGEKPSVVTSSTAEEEYGEGVLEYVDETKHYGNVLGSNEFKEKRLGAVIGSNHYGDDYIKKWGAYAGDAVERNGGKGKDLSYGDFGNDVLQHMREHDTLQAAMRFGRDGNGAVVFVHTDTLPDWVPIAGEARVLKTWSDGMQSVINALERTGGTTAADLAECVDLSRRQVFDHLETLRKRGVLTRTRDTNDGRRFTYRATGLEQLNEHGAVDLEANDTPELDDLEFVGSDAYEYTYTWEFLQIAGDTHSDSDALGGSVTGDGSPVKAGSDPPPNPGD